MDTTGTRSGLLHPLVVALIARSLQRLAPDLVPPDYDFDALLAQDAVPTVRKFEMLDAAYARGGARLVLRIGSVLRHPELPPQPVLFLLENTSSVRELLVKYQQLCPALNTRNRIELRELADDHAVVEHVVAGGGWPEHVESLHICGLALAMLEVLGCRGLEVHLRHDDRRASLAYRDGEYFEPGPGPVSRWAFRWRAFEPRHRLAGLDEYLRDTVPLPALEERLSPQQRLVRLVRGAPARGWTLAEASHELGFSARSLQRALAGEGTGFAELLWRTRVELAQELLLRGELSVTEVALRLGFSDGSHFCRRFGEATGCSPAEFRRRVASRPRQEP